MFSPDATISTSIALRNPRRRQRTGSDDPIATRQNPKRQRRSGLTSETFKPFSFESNNAAELNGRVALTTDGHSAARSRRNTPTDNASLAIRHRVSKQHDHERREDKCETNVVLTKNENYVVTRLTTTPIQLQESQSTETWQGELAVGAGIAVATTQTQALVWRYSHDTGRTGPTKPLIIPLLHPSNSALQPLPLGFIVPTSPEPGLLIVMPVSGKVTYWENLSNAASVDPGRRKQQASEGTVGGLLSGETITTITEAEPHGYLLTLSTGRVAHMAIVDVQGKPDISVQFLRSNGAHAGGLFSGLRSVFTSSGWRRDIAAVKAGASWKRGQRQCIIATMSGTFQVWDLNWNGAHSLLYETDIKSKLLASVWNSGDFFHDKDEHPFQILDFVFLPHDGLDNQVAKSTSHDDCKLLVLTALSGPDSCKYNLLALKLREADTEIEVVHPVSCYTLPFPADAKFKPWLVVPAPKQTAFIVFEKTVILVSLAEVEDTPDSQLQMETQTLPDPFQDSINIRKDKAYRIVGCNAQPGNGAKEESCCIVMVQGYGVINISVLPAKEGQSSFDRARITARTKIEQAIFYGTKPQNPLDFSGHPETQFGIEDVEEAALKISQSIMGSTSAYLPQLVPALDQLLQLRASALGELIKHLRKYHDDVSQRIRWQLLWDAEKIAAAKAVCVLYSAKLDKRTEGQKSYLNEVIDCIHERYKTQNDRDNQEPDGVRHWMIHDVSQLEYLFAYAQETYEVLLREGKEDNKAINVVEQAQLINEANDYQMAILEAAFNFRTANSASYGLDDQVVIDGILQNGYEDLPSPWTSDPLVYAGLYGQADTSQKFLVQHGNAADEDGFPSLDLLKKMAIDNARQVDLCCRSYGERLLFLNSKDDPQLNNERKSLEKDLSAIRNQFLVDLVEIGQAKSALRLAEKYHDMVTLAEIVVEETSAAQDVLSTPNSHGSESEEEMQVKLSVYRDCVDRYFTTWGSIWADAFFTRLISEGKSGSILDHAQKHRQHVTAFLRSSAKYAKVGWINEVLSEKDYASGGQHLRLLQRDEADLWSKKIQLSMSKLSLMAAKSNKQVTENQGKSLISDIDRDLGGVAAQEKLHAFLVPILRETLNDSIARTQAVMGKYGDRFVRHKPALKHSMENSVRKVVAGEVLAVEEIVDVLTLMDEDAFNPMDQSDEAFTTERFFLALRLLHSNSPDVTDRAHLELLEKIIWRRCMIQNNWTQINHTELKPDTEVEVETGATALFKTLKEGFKEGLPHCAPTIQRLVSSD